MYASVCVCVSMYVQMCVCVCVCTRFARNFYRTVCRQKIIRVLVSDLFLIVGITNELLVSSILLVKRVIKIQRKREKGKFISVISGNSSREQCSLICGVGLQLFSRTEFNCTWTMKGKDESLFYKSSLSLN